MIPVTPDMFEEWTGHPVTQKFFKKLLKEREEMKENLVNDIYEFPDKVKGRCECIALILDIKYEDMFDEQQPQRD
mgnify:CR=1 FL=1